MDLVSICSALCDWYLYWHYEAVGKSWRISRLAMLSWFSIATWGCMRRALGERRRAHGVSEVLVAFDLCAEPEERLCPCVTVGNSCGGCKRGFQGETVESYSVKP